MYVSANALAHDVKHDPRPLPRDTFDVHPPFVLLGCQKHYLITMYHLLAVLECFLCLARGACELPPEGNLASRRSDMPNAAAHPAKHTASDKLI